MSLTMLRTLGLTLQRLMTRAGRILEAISVIRLLARDEADA